jgi:hypothetical protein
MFVCFVFKLAELLQSFVMLLRSELEYLENFRTKLFARERIDLTFGVLFCCNGCD